MAVDPVVAFYMIQLLIAAVAVFCEVILHILISRFVIKKGTVVSTIVAYSIGLGILCGMELAYQKTGQVGLEETLAFILINFILYSGMAFLYFCFVNIGETSVRIRVLRELFAAKDGLNCEELLEKYSVDHIINVRIERMLRSGEMSLRDGRYYFSGRSKMLLVAKGSQWLKKLMLGKQSFESPIRNSG